MSLILESIAFAETRLTVPVSDKPFHADLTAVDANGQLTLQIGQKQYVMQMADLVSWGACPEQGRAGGLVLADGGWLAANILSADRESLTIDSELFGTQKLPLKTISGVIFHASSNPSQRDKLFENFSPLPLGEGQGVRAESSDFLLLDNGDSLTGQFLAMADATVKFQTDVGPIDVKTDRITALIFHPTLKNTPVEAWTGFTDGSRLKVSQLLTKDGLLHITSADQPLTVSQNALVFLQPLGSHVIYLSDLKPTEYHQTPYLDLAWPYQPDRNVTGGFLRCDGHLYLKGIGVHSAARLVYNLSPLPLGYAQGNKNSPLPLGEGQGVRAFGAPKRFQAELGIDDSTSNRGSVRFRVLVDGRERYASPIIRGGQPPVPVSVDVRGARRLELLVDYADCADVLDRADWLNARLVR